MKEEQTTITEEEIISMIGQEAWDKIVWNSNHPEMSQRRPRPRRVEDK